MKNRCFLVIFLLMNGYMGLGAVETEKLPVEEKPASTIFVEKKLPDEATILKQHKKEIDSYKEALVKVRAYEQELKKLKMKPHQGFVFDDIEDNLKKNIHTAQKKANSIRSQLRDSLVRAGLMRDRADALLNSL